VKLHHQPSGLHEGLELLIDSHGSPEQAMAVFELLEDLRDRVWAHYEFALATQFAEDRVYRCDVVDSDPPF
jgi:hypothetical protein